MQPEQITVDAANTILELQRRVVELERRMTEHEKLPPGRAHGTET